MKEDTSSSTSESHWAGAWEDRDDAGERMGGGGRGEGGRGEERAKMHYHQLPMFAKLHLMRDEEEERSKQGQTNKANKQGKQTRQSNTAHPWQSLFQRKMSCLGWDSNPRHSTL